MRISRLLATALAGLAVCTPLGAQAPAADPLYYVEIIVFAHLNANRGEEDFRHDRESLVPAPAPRLYEFPTLDLETLPAFGSAAPAFGGSIAVPSGAPDPGVAAEPGVDPNAAPPPPRTDGLELIELVEGRAQMVEGFTGDSAPLPDGFRLLQADELALTADAGRLARSANYRVLGHVGWEQPGVEENLTEPIDLRHLGITNPGGTIKFWISRIRHVVVDLEYVDGSGSFWSAPADSGLASLVYPEIYRLQRASNDYLREPWYVDHPLFGVLILVRPAPEPANTGGANPAGGPAA